MQPLIFFGSDQYSATVLAALLESRIYLLVSVVTDQTHDKSPVEKLALKHNLKVTYYPANKDEINTLFDSLKIWFSDSIPFGLCASFDHLIPKEIIEKFAGNLYNLHPSLLPQYRNVSPVQYALAMGDKETGITLFRISPGIDDGAIISQVAEPILSTDTTPALTTRLFTLGAQLFIDASKTDFPPLESSIYLLESNALIFTHRLKRDSGYIEWSVLRKLLDNQTIQIGESKNELLNLRLKKESATPSHLESRIYLLGLIRALSPWPTVWSTVPTRKGDLRISIVPVDIQYSVFSVLISGKPKPISYNDFTKYYL